MAKFINRKQQVYDLKLTNYGHYLLSIGKMEPVYYAFMDDNIIYDGQYTGLTEKQNEITERIRNDSQYIESLVTFQDPENQLTTYSETYYDEDGIAQTGKYYETDVTAMRIEPRVDSYIYTAIIGDAYLEGDTQTAPAWKIVALEGTIMSSSLEDTKNDVKIPQINIDVNYSLEIKDYDANIILTQQDFRDTMTTTDVFYDNRVITLAMQDLLVYGEEFNTELLTENFEIEVFEITGSFQRCATCKVQDRLERKYFSNDNTAVRGGTMTVAKNIDGSMLAIADDGRPLKTANEDPTTDSVSYYFDITIDDQVSQQKACRLASDFNKNSYYVDLGFDCENLDTTDPLSPDIYGKVTEPEICL